MTERNHPDPAADPASGADPPDPMATVRAARSRGGKQRRVTRYYIIGVFADGRHDLLSECRSPQGARNYVNTVGPAIGRHYARIGVIRGRDVTDRVLGADPAHERSEGDP